MISKMWNLWHGCQKYSEGCRNCYVYRTDSRFNRDASTLFKTQNFDLPTRRKKDKSYQFNSGTFFYTCFTSDFLLDKCDEWRLEAWEMIRERTDCHFLFLTKRIERFECCAPNNWVDGFDNVTVGVSCENQETADIRLPILKSLPIKHKVIIHEPLLTPINISQYLDSEIEEVVVGGESGNEARPCRFDWVLDIRDQCVAEKVPFTFKQTGTYFIKDEVKYRIPRRLQHIQAKKAAINYLSRINSELRLI